MTTATIIMYITVVVALAFDVINGFHDAANAIATIVSTRVLTPRIAVLWAAVFNFVALFLFHEGVAKTVAGLVKLEPGDPAFSFVVLAGLLGAIFWNLLTWWWGLPSSSSHALMGGFSGAGLAYGGFKVLKLEKLALTAEFIVLSPVMGFMLGGLFLLALAWVFRKWRPARVDRTFRVGQLLSAAAYSIGHGANDAQKTMGIIIAALVAGGRLAPDSNDSPGWIAPACYACMAVGTSMGGWRIVRTMGSKLVHLRPFGGFCAELAGACTLFIATHFKIPVSTTHTITGAILGVGSTTRLRGVRWGLASRIIWAWVFTIPAAASVSALCLWIFHRVGFY
ncbi:MAG: inorganic phosphate transporter [Deltaproteobacteria bacterium]|nr:inorganic phosphate transporter [Deltaproteobacteria bacterium]